MKPYQDRGWLEQKYTIEGLSTHALAKICARDSKTIWAWLTKHGIKTRTKSEANKGKNYRLDYHHTEETKIKIAKANKGKRPANKGKKFLRKEDHPCWGKILSEKTKKKIGEAQKRFRVLFPGKFLGENSSNWKGGITPENQKIRTSLEFKQWRRSVFNRDDYTCQKCGAKSGNGKAIYLHAHHLLPFAEYPEKRFDINNGLTLCKECHFGGPT
jgi:hypothetical protein